MKHVLDMAFNSKNISSRSFSLSILYFKIYSFKASKWREYKKGRKKPPKLVFLNDNT